MSNPLALAVNVADYLLTKKLKHLILHVTGKCNFRCDHCFVDFGNKKRDLPLSSFQELSNETPKLFWLDIAGGEPFLRKDLYEIVSLFDSNIVHIPTNGSLIPEMIEQINKIKSQVNSELIIGLSLDGLESTHDKIRNTPGSYNQVWDAFNELKKMDVSVKVTTVLNKDNFNEIPQLMDEVYSHGVDFHSIILLRGEPLDPNMCLPSLKELRKFEPFLFAKLKRYNYNKGYLSARLLRNFHKYLWDISLKTLEKETQIIPCLAGKTQLTIDSDGSVSSCEMLPSVGNLHNKSLNEIRSSKEFIQQLKDIEDKKCFCTHNCAMLDSIFFDPKNLKHLL